MWSCHACVQFEQRGVPATLIATDAFEAVARRILKSLGYSHIPILVTPNPVVYLTEPQIHARIDTLRDEIVASFVVPLRA
ncbi:MAG: UGSC family (seleno)protein [Burkholderiales bacterium]